MQIKADVGHLPAKAPATSKEHYVSLAQAAANAQAEASHSLLTTAKHMEDGSLRVTSNAHSVAADDNGSKALPKTVQVENEVGLRSKEKCLFCYMVYCTPLHY